MQVKPELDAELVERIKYLEQQNHALQQALAQHDELAASQKENWQKYESLIQSIDGIVWEADPAAFRISFISQQAQRILGYPLSTWYEPDFWANHIHPEDSDWVLTFSSEATQQRKDFQIEYRMIAADGRVLWFRDVVTVEVANQQATLLRGVMVDITEKKRTEEERKQLLHDLQERVKELTALHAAMSLLQQEFPTLPEMFRQLVELLPPAFRFPDKIKARINVGAIESGPPLSPDLQIMKAEFTTAEGEMGAIEIASTGECPLAEHGPFLEEERALIMTLAEMVKISVDRRQSEEQLRTTTDQLRALSAKVSFARELERTVIAREIHDELGSALTSLRWDLESLEGLVPEQLEQSQGDKLSLKVRSMLDLTDDIVRMVRRIASDLRPSILDDLGLVAAIEWQADQFQTRTGIVCRCDCELEGLQMTSMQSTELFRIFQEALTNVLRHAQATAVAVTVEQDDGRFVLTVTDNGRGIREHEKTGRLSLGILGMRERVHLIEGELQIKGVPDEGTSVRVSVPVST